jgi:hypothetical protein
MIDNNSTHRDFLISELHRLREKLGKIPTKPDLKFVEGYPTLSDFQNEFGQWSLAIVAAFPNEKYITKNGLLRDIKKEDKEIEDLIQNSSEGIINILLEEEEEKPEETFVETKALSELLDEDSTEKKEESVTHIQYIKPNYNALFNFGFNLKTEANMDVINMNEREFLINELRRFELNNNRIPLKDDLKKSLGYPGIKRYKKEFGPLTKALKIAFNSRKVTLLYGFKTTYIISDPDRFKKIESDEFM